ncbi:MAG: CvpA family protein [Candidatus Dadabacteria bacterium]|nr:CvpA family protein [Candidatus Dadabacteria bacterium]
MHWLDITLLAIITVFAAVGIWRGFISQVFSVLALVVGLAAGIMFYGRLGQALMERGVVENEPMANVIAFVALVVVFYIAVQLIGWLTAKLTGALQLGLLNRLAGGALGAVFGAMTALMLVSALGFLYSQNNPMFKDSVVLPYLNEGSRVAKALVPEDLGASVEKARELIQKEGFEAAMKLTDSEALREILGGAAPAGEPTGAPAEAPKVKPTETPR